MPSPLINDDSIDAEARRNKGLTPQEREVRRQQAICGVYQKTDRILLGSINLRVVGLDEAGMPPGWTTGEEIYINFNKLPGRTDKELVAMWGLNYHELGHVIFTPRIKGELREKVRDPHWRLAMNIAEDWRVETQFAGLFNAAFRYFRMTFSQLIVEDKKKVKAGEHLMFPLSCGRFFLPLGMRERYYKKFGEHYLNSCRLDEITDPAVKAACLASPHADLGKLKGFERADAIQQVADEYVTKFWSSSDRNVNRAIVDLIEKLMVLLPFEMQEAEGNFGFPAKGSKGTTGGDLPSQGKPSRDLDEDAVDSSIEIVARDQEERERLRQALKDREKMDVAGDEDDEDGEGGDEAGEDGEDEQEGAGEEGDSEKAQGDSAGDQKKKKRPPRIVVDPNQTVNQGGSGKGSASDLDDAAGHLSASAGSGGGWEGEGDYEAQLSAQDLKDIEDLFRNEAEFDALLSEEVRRELNSKAVQRDLKTIRHAVGIATGEGLHLQQTGKGVARQVPPPILAERNQLERELIRIRSQLEGSWLPDQPSGKINLRAWMNASPAQKISAFRSWLPDELDEAGLEVVLLIDRSSSMASAIDHASQIAWAIASAAQNAECKVTLIGFADPGKEEVLIGRNDTLERGNYTSYSTYGGTTITEALKMARQVLACSPMSNQLLAIVTDGGWSDIEGAVKEIKKINADGAESLLVLLGLHMERSRRACKHVVHANDVAAMSRELKKVVKKIEVSAVRRVAQSRGVVVS